MSDHIPGVTKMISDTPRTDAKRGFHDLDTAVDAEFSEQLERELNAANERIKRLEEAVEAYRTAYTPDGHVAPHDCFATGPMTGNPIQDLIACPGCWAERKAKEAKL